MITTNHRTFEQSLRTSRPDGSGKPPAKPHDTPSDESTARGRGAHAKSPPVHKPPAGAKGAPSRAHGGEPRSSAPAGGSAPSHRPSPGTGRTSSSTANRVLAQYGASLEKLPGVVRVAAGKEGLVIETTSKARSKTLDALLEDSIGWLPVHFKEREGAPKPPTHATHPRAKDPAGKTDGREPAPPRPHLSAAEKVAKRYSKIIASLPHVVGVAAAPYKSVGSSKEGGGSGLAETIIVKVDRPEAVRALDGMLEDTINGVFVQFEPASSLQPGRN